ncbi:hypothetical protein K505DRAFT_328624 [Melanomma pulvis-pyrius CBS 109.77]|uniref:Uncharacterized protein n=1 Tax=Melanomma pulvis-pyrius CBS 109.77 TaxID=1314802 RepID=A0A6A6WYA0_9PLEO|nr:hypothetical protein K505DRAFT_328624 [Melanomma pulvis-pyrius CBS 109.77]
MEEFYFSFIRDQTGALVKPAHEINSPSSCLPHGKQREKSFVFSHLLTYLPLSQTRCECRGTVAHNAESIWRACWSLNRGTPTRRKATECNGRRDCTLLAFKADVFLSAESLEATCWMYMNRKQPQGLSLVCGVQTPWANPSLSPSRKALSAAQMPRCGKSRHRKRTQGGLGRLWLSGLNKRTLNFNATPTSRQCRMSRLAKNR